MINVLFSSNISFLTGSIKFCCVPVSAVTYKGLKNEQAGTVKDRQSEKQRERREEQCLSNTEWVASHICPCRVCEVEKEREGDSLGIPCFLSAGHAHWDLSGKCFLSNTCLSSFTLITGGRGLEDAALSSLLLAESGQWLLLIEESEYCQKPFPIGLLVTYEVRVNSLNSHSPHSITSSLLH